MKGLISEDEIQLEKHSMSFMDMCGFDMGIQFAEEKLKNIAVEFAEYIKYECWISMSDEFYMPTDEGDITYCSTELFEKFIEQRSI